MGCVVKREYPSTIKNRSTPYLQLRPLEEPSFAMSKATEKP
jgi:hypothetical protein